jgi:hypothetical protein
MRWGIALLALAIIVISTLVSKRRDVAVDAEEIAAAQAA